MSDQKHRVLQKNNHPGGIFSNPGDGQAIRGSWPNEALQRTRCAGR